MKIILKLIIKFYKKFISPIFPAQCRFYPTCSQYALDAIEIHGAVKGSYLAVKRICRCHPYSKKCGYDPVPQKKDKKTDK